MSEKDDKKITYIEEKRFAILTKESIKLIADAAGCADLSDDVAALLGEDVSYRLREAAQVCSLYHLQSMPNAVCPMVLTGKILSGQTNSHLLPDRISGFDTGVFKNL